MKKIIIASIATLGLVTAASAAVNAASCTGCHGADWSKKAMNKSMVVADMSHADIAAKLLAFKAGTEGTIMKNMVKKYSNEELEAFAQTIGK